MSRIARLSVVLLIAILSAVPLAGQKSATARTPDGQPDLQGVWSFATITPLERPPDLAGKQFFTEKEVIDYEKNTIGIKASNNNIILSFSLIRQREMSKSTVREVADRLGSKSPNSYAQYERGKMRLTLDQYERLLEAVNPERPPILRVV